MPKRRSTKSVASTSTPSLENDANDSPNEVESEENSEYSKDSDESSPPAAKKQLLDKKVKSEEFGVFVKEEFDFIEIDEESSNNLTNFNRNDEEESQGIEDFEEDDDDTDSVLEKIEVPEVDKKFAKHCEKLGLSQEVVENSWELYYHATQRVLLEGDVNAWQLVAIYHYFLSKNLKKRGKLGRIMTTPMPVALNDLLAEFNVCPVEFFDKIHRFIDTINSRRMRRYNEYMKRLQENLAITAVVFKKYVNVFRLIFNYVKEEDRISSKMVSTEDLFLAIWLTFLVMKKKLIKEDLLNSCHLLFCVIEMIYTELCNSEGADLYFNQNFVEILLSKDMTILRALCLNFDGVVIDAKHFSEHIFLRMSRDDLPTNWDLKSDFKEILNSLNDVYLEWILVRGQVDERIFVPKTEDIKQIFEKDYKEDVVLEVLRKTKDSPVEFKDAEFLSDLSNQACLENLAFNEQKNGAQKMVAARDVARVPTIEQERCPDDKDPIETAQRLKRIVGNWDYETSNLKRYCSEMSDDPSVTLLLKKDVLSERFYERIRDVPRSDPRYDSYFLKGIIDHRKQLENLFMLYIEKILVSEIDKKCKEEDLLNVMRREEFLDSVFCFCIELILFCNGSLREFPWSAETCEVHPFFFHKVIDLMINHEKGLSRPMVQHFNQIEERIIEELAWKDDSPLWSMIVRCPLKNFKEFGEDWFDKGQSPLKFSPIKKRSTTDDMGRPIQNTPGQSRTLRMFLKRTYFTAALRFHDLCDQIGMGTRAKSQVWTLFDFVLRSETSQLMGRHLDQILMCCVYVVTKVNTMGTTFMEIMALYKRQPQGNSRIYREVKVLLNDSSSEESPKKNMEEIITRLEGKPRPFVHVDIIKYYNCIFRDRVKVIMKDIESEETLSEMPVPTCYGLAPVKINISKNVAVQALPKTIHGSTRQEIVIANMAKTGLVYDVLSSPRKELKLINSRIAGRI